VEWFLVHGGGAGWSEYSEFVGWVRRFLQVDVLLPYMRVLRRNARWVTQKALTHPALQFK
jgi:alkylated DNA nucleotide flippase Atl1